MTRRKLLAGSVPALGAGALLLGRPDGARPAAAPSLPPAHGGHGGPHVVDHGGHAAFRGEVNHVARAFLVVGFAIHNTTEGLAIVAPIANARPRARRLVLLGLLAGGPAVLGAWIGAAAFNASAAAFLFGLGAGAIAQVVVQLAPLLRDRAGRLLHPPVVGGLLTGMGLMYATGLLVSV